MVTGYFAIENKDNQVSAKFFITIIPPSLTPLLVIFWRFIESTFSKLSMNLFFHSNNNNNKRFVELSGLQRFMITDTFPLYFLTCHLSPGSSYKQLPVTHISLPVTLLVAFDFISVHTVWWYKRIGRYITIEHVSVFVPSPKAEGKK